MVNRLGSNPLAVVFELMAKSEISSTVADLKRLLGPILFVSLLSSCGGGGDSQPSPDPTPNPPPTVPVPTPEPAPAPTIVAFDYVQKANNKAYNATQVQSASFSNATGGFRLPLADQSLTGNLTISVDLEDPDGINNVYVGFEGGSNALELCASQCGVTYHRTVTGINPLDHGRNSGPQQLQLWEQDTAGNKTFLTTVNFTWNKTAVTGLNATRTAGSIDLSWNALNNYLRYNVYVASQAGVTHENYQSMPDGQAFLALRDPRKILSGKEDAKAFFTAVTAIDGSGESAFSESMKVSALSGAEDFDPTAVNDHYFMDEDTTLIENVLANDSDLESQTLTINTGPIRLPQNGTLLISPDGTINYTPTTDFVGRDNFSYSISDGLGQTAEAVVIITVNPANDPPESSFNNFNLIDPGQGKSITEPFNLTETSELTTNLTTSAQALLSVAAPGLLINDLDIDGNFISVVTTPAVDPTQGTVTLNANGSFEYTNAPGSSGEDTFSYRTTDGTTVSDPPTVVRITINGASFFPVAANDRYTLTEGQTFVADNSGVGRMSILNNDSDLDAGDVLSINTSFVRSVAHGTLNMGADGTFTYIPTPGYFGTDSFIYQITDLQGNTAQAGGIFTIVRGNTAPIATIDAYPVIEDTPYTADATTGVLGNDSDVDFDPIKVDITPVQAPVNGQLTLAVDGSFVYVPNANFAGSDSFSYSVSDDRGGVSTGAVTLTVSNVNDIPVALDDTVQTVLNSPVTIAVLSNDSDVENQPLTVTNAVVTTGGVVINGDNTLTYTPPTGFLGAVEIDYTITDGADGNASAKVFVSVDNVNIIPVAANDSYALNEDQALIVNGNNQPLLTANDSDANGDTLTINTTAQTNPANGSVTLAADGTFSYLPNANFFGNDSFTYQVLDGRGGSATATVALTIAAVNDAPVANTDSVSTSEETLININPLGNDTDVENDTLTLINAATNNGTVTVQNNNTLNYVPVLNFVGVTQVSYLVSDNNGGSSTGIINVTVININDAPVALDDTINTQENTAVTINVLTNDSDVDGDTLVVLGATVSNPNNGSVATNANNSLLFTPTNNFNGNALIDYTISDNNGGTASATVTVNVISVNSTPVAVNDSATTDEDTLATINVLANDSDADGDTLTVTNPTAINGTVSVNPDSSLDYLPNANFNGNDTISYNINDGNGATDSATVAVTITPINDAPVGVADTSVTNEDNAININVLANDTDIDSNASALTVTGVSAINGTTTVLPDQSIAYNPLANFNGVDTISYTVNDNLGGASSTTVAVTVIAQNDAPIALNDVSTTDEDTSVIINVLANDSDIDGDTLTINSTAANNGTVIVNADNSLSYSPSSNFNGADTISYTLSDGNGLTASASVAVTVNPVNDLPVAVNDLASTAEDIAINIVVLANDTDVENSPLTVTNATATNGTVAVAANNSLDYTPTANFNGTDTISYSIVDSDGGTASATVLVTVSGTNDLPIAQVDSINTNEDTSVNIDVLANDSDPDGDTLSISSATATNGSVATTNNTLDYTPNANFNGSDTINYTINDGQGGTATSTVLVSIAPVNDLPIAVNDSAQVIEDASTNINVLANDSDLDNDPLTVIAATAITGTVTTATNNTLNYVPSSNFNGTDTISYTISDGQGGTASSTVTLSVLAINDNPIANTDTATTNEDTNLTVDVLANDSDIDNDSLTVVATSASNGATAVNANQSVSYTPNANFNGNDVLTYTISDGQGGSAISTVSITVAPVNDSPVAVSDSSATTEDTAININVLANDSDIDDDSLSITTFSASSGTVSVELDNTLTYTPNNNFNGIDSINYAILDGNGGTDATTVTVTVSAVNDAPIAVADTVTTLEDTSTTIAVLTNDSDIDNDALSVTGASATNGTTTITNNVISYTPNANFFGSDTITYTIADTNDATATSTVAVTVTSVNDVPVATADSQTTDEDTSFTINVLTNDSDADGDTLTVTAATTTEGTVSIISADNTLDYVPTANFNGSVTINYTVEDGNGGSASSTVAVTVTAINDAPVAIAETLTMDEDTITDIDVLANDTDADNDFITISGVSANNGTAVINTTTPAAVEGNGTIGYTPNANFNGSDTITYTIEDSSGATASSTVTVTINSVNDVPIATQDTATTDEDVLVNIDVLANDIDNDGDSLTVSAVTASNGTVVVQADNTLNYTPTADFNGLDTINYTITDPTGTSGSTTVSVTVAGVNDNPIAVNDSQSTPEDTAVNISVLSNDTDVEGDTLTITSASATNGSVSFSSSTNSGTSLDYIPNADFNGSDTITYAISDGNGGAATATVSVTVTPVADTPIAVADIQTTDEDTTVSIAVLANDSDADGDTLTITSVSASSGSVSIVNSSSLSYSPSANFNGTDIINYTISDGSLTASTSVTVTVASVEDAPVALADTKTTDEDTTTSISVLDNDSDGDGDTLTVTAATTSNGSVSIINNTSLSYTPTADFNGTDTINYTITDGKATATSTVTVTITPVADAPIAVVDIHTLDEDTTTSITVLANDTDADGDTLTITAATIVSNTGQVSIVSGNTLSYTPQANFNGTDTINYTISDGALTASSTVTLTINSVEDLPVAVADTKTTDEDLAVNITPLDNDSDADGDTLTITAATTSNGSVSIVNNTSLTYTPVADFNGSATIDYTISDGKGTATSTVTVTVNPVADTPVAVADSQTINEDTATSIAVLDNDTDADGDTLTVTAASVDEGVLSIINNTTLSYTPKANFFGTKTINYTISDGALTASSTVTLTIESVEDVPIAVADTQSTAEDTSANIDVLDNDSDGDGDTLTITAASATTGSVSIDRGSNLIYTPVADFNGSDTINYTISDGKATASSTVAVTITAVADAPIAVDDTQTTDEDTNVSIVVTTNDTDADGDTLTVTAATMVTTNGTVTVLTGTTIAYAPNSNFHGTETISYTVSDGALTSTGNVTVTVTSVNDDPVADTDTADATEDTMVTLSPLANDSDIDGDVLTITAAAASNGTATIVGNNINYTPSANFNGTDTVTYSISDGVGASPGTAASSITVTIAAVDDLPIAVADIASTDEDNLVNIDILGNDIEVDGDTLLVQAASATHGSVSVETDKTLNYTPPSNFEGSDTINYTIFDGTTAVSTTVAVTVNAINDNPVAVTDTISVDEDTLITIDVLNNDTDVENGTLSITSQSALHGTVSLNNTNGPKLDFTSSTNYNGADVITYTISDGTGGVATGTVNITVDPVNDAPITEDETVSLDEDTDINIDVLTNDSDIENNTLMVSAVATSNGTTVIESDNTLTFTPTLNYNGSALILYTVSDSFDINTATVTITVNPISDVPIANTDTVSTNEDILLNIDILDNDSDPDGGVLTIDVATADNGVVTIKNDKTLDYVPNVNYHGSDIINYTISNITGPTSAKVNITVVPQNDDPTISPITASVNENMPNGTIVTTMTGTDIDGDSLTYSIVTNSSAIFDIGPTSGEITIVDSNNLNYETAVRHEITVKAQDPGGKNATATATINVNNLEESVTPTLDATFATAGIGGSNAMASERYDLPNDSVIDAAGRLIVVGRNSYSGSDADIFIARYNTDGTLDRTFGDKGMINKDLTGDNNEDEATAVAIDSANNIVVAGFQSNGSAQEVFVIRYTSTGTLDTSFNSTGYRLTTFGIPTVAADMAIHSSGAIIVAGSVATGDMRLMKFAEDGSSHLTIDIDFFGNFDTATSLVLQSDGKALISGPVYNSPPQLSVAPGTLFDFGVARVDVSSSPTLDTSYNSDGKAAHDFGNSLDDVPQASYINASNELYLAGLTDINGGTDMAVLKLDINGDLDTAFNGNGMLIVDIDGDAGAGSGESVALNIAADNLNNLFFAAEKGVTSSTKDNVIYKTDSAGLVDTSYGTSGQVVFDHNNDLNLVGDLKIDSSNRAILTTTSTINIEPDVVIARFTTAGVLDTSFDSDGIVILDATFSADNMHEIIELTVAPHAGKFVAVGTTSAGAGNALIVARYDANGAIDETFGHNGYFVHRGDEATITGKDIVELSDGKLVAVGSYDDRGLVLMIKNDGTLEASFGSSGTLKISSNMLALNAVAVDGNNKIVVAGTDGSAGTDIYIARMSTTGTLDSTFATTGEFKLDLTLAETVEDIAIQSDNAIVAVGNKGNYGLVFRVLDNGTLDTAGFAAGDGYLSQDLDPSAGNTDTLMRVKIKASGKIVAAGYTTLSGPTITNAIIQVNSNGTLDTSFGASGIASYNYGSSDTKTLAMAFDASERVLTTGYNNNGSSNNIFIARVTTTGAVDTQFNDATGSLSIINNNGSESASAILFRADGTVIIAGSDNLSQFPTNFFYIQKFNLVEP